MGYACIVPIHGRIELLRACLNSLITQSLLPQEIIVVSDHNAPAEELQIETIVRDFPLARMVKNLGERSASIARNVGAKAVSADFLLFVDSDTCFKTHAAADLMSALDRNSTAAFAYGDFLFGGHRMKGQDFSADALKKQNYISTMSLVRTASFPGFDESLARFQDWDLWLTIAERGGVGVYVPEILFETNFGGTMSTRIPSIAAKFPKIFLWWPRVKKMYDARRVIEQKHHLIPGDRA